ncbi:hypothetical protein diail_11137 [Diaporthe ilicicola]|nr:hypothetical protein diail_11137 [Diaporthe ilicicola]
MDDDKDFAPSSERSEQPARKRLRTSHACDVCRARKIRCDGNNPCTSCSLSEQDCTYGSEANSRGKSDLILEGVLRVEKFLHDLNASVIASPLSERRPSFFSQPAGPQSGSPLFEESPVTETHAYRTACPPRTPISETAHQPPPDFKHNQQSQHSQGGQLPNGQNGFDNAVLDSMHTSTTESVLQWPHFDVFPSLRNDYVSIFELEQSRPPIKMRPSAVMYPFVTDDEMDSILDAFQNGVNWWYPTMSHHQLEKVRLTVKCFNAGVAEEHSVEACLAFLTMALGCACQATAGLASAPTTTAATTTTNTATTAISDDDNHDEDLKRRAQRREMGDLYFDHALRRLHVAHMDVGSTATQCLFFAAMYFASLRRPLQAWEYISAASAKCLLLLSYPPGGGGGGAASAGRGDNETAASGEDAERIRRIFWSCYVLESDYLAELSALPQSGIARIESSIPLPGAYGTHRPLGRRRWGPRQQAEAAGQEQQSSLYFLACISMRRLLNRVHQLLYARGTGASLDAARFPYVVAELNHQLDEWRDVLPSAFSFSTTLGANCPTQTEAGGFLRQRYLTCRSVIYRPYLMWMLSGSGDGGDGLSVHRPSPDVLSGCRACLDACLLHILNLRGFAQTVLVDTWICSLSMAGAMLVLLAASRVPSLRGVIGPDLLTAGAHLKGLLTSWQRVSGGPSSPSVDQAVRIICEADEFISQVFAAGDMLALYGQGSDP